MKYNDQQRIGAIAAWNLWTPEIRAAIDAAIDAHRESVKNDETQCCLDCGTALVPCTCRNMCPGGECPVCP